MFIKIRIQMKMLIDSCETDYFLSWHPLTYNINILNEWISQTTN